MKVKKEVAEKLKTILEKNPDIRISDLLIETLEDKDLITIKCELIRRKKAKGL